MRAPGSARDALAILALASLAAGAAACGSRSDLLGTTGDGAGGGQGGATGTAAGGSTPATGGGGSTGTTGSTGGSAPFECAQLSLALDLIVPAPSPGLARAPQIALLDPVDPGHEVLSFLDSPGGEAGALLAFRVDAFAEWPPAFDGPALLDEGVIAYAAGPGPSGPVGLLHPAGAPATLATALYPQLVAAEAPFTAGDAILFAAGIPDRTFVAQSTQAPGYGVLGLGSYQPGSLPQGEGPLVCITSPVLAAGVPSGAGFLVAYLEPDPPEPGCDPAAPHPGTVVSVSRYEAPPGLGTFLERTQGLRLHQGEPAAHLALAQASSGGWLVFQTDGSTARIPPPIVALRLDAAGNALAPDELIPVSPGGAVVPALAAAGLGDALAVAWIDALDPSAPVIAVQIVGPDGALGAAASIPTNAAWYAGGLQLLASPAGDSLLVAWETFDEGGRVALARLDCKNTQ